MKMRLAFWRVAVGIALSLLATVSAQTYVELILDASGSMYNTLDDGRYRIVAAKEVLSSFIAGLPSAPDLNVGLRVYGSELQATHKDACLDSRLFVPMQGVDRTALLDTVDTVLARGATPIAWSLQQAGADFTEPGRYLIVLVTDGEESCGGDIRQVMADLAASGIDIDLRIIGFDLTEQASRSFEGVGTFENVRTAAELAAALGRAVEEAVAPAAEQLHQVTVTLTRGGEPVTEGAVLTFSVTGAEPARFMPGDGVWRAELPAGNYTASIEDAHSAAPLVVSGLRVLPDAGNSFSFELAPESLVTLTVPEGNAVIGQEISVSWTGAPDSGEHWITVVAADAADTVHGPGAWVSGSSGSGSARLPDRGAGRCTGWRGQCLVLDGRGYGRNGPGAG